MKLLLFPLNEFKLIYQTNKQNDELMHLNLANMPEHDFPSEFYLNAYQCGFGVFVSSNMDGFRK